MTGASPRVRIAGECARRGRAEVVDGCVSILRGNEPDPGLSLVLGGPAAMRMLAGDSRADVDLWTRVWALRGLLWALDDASVERVAPVILSALQHRAWRVREKAA